MKYAVRVEWTAGEGDERVSTVHVRDETGPDVRELLRSCNYPHRVIDAVFDDIEDDNLVAFKSRDGATEYTVAYNRTILTRGATC